MQYIITGRVRGLFQPCALQYFVQQAAGNVPAMNRDDFNLFSLLHDVVASLDPDHFPAILLEKF